MKTAIGIHGFGVAIPRRELSHAATFEAWDRPSIKGARRIAGPDEDSLTLGLSAAYQALQNLDVTTIDGLIFATSTSPYQEKSVAAIMAEALALNINIKTLDVGGSARSGTQAMQTAFDFIQSSCRNVLVVVADTRIAKPGVMDEFMFGHAGVAFVLGFAETAMATISHCVNQTDSHSDSWQGATARFPTNADVRFSRNCFQALMQSTFEQLLSASTLQASDIHKMVIWSPDAKSGMGFLKGNGFDIQKHYADAVSYKGGLTGAPHVLLMLVGALESAQQGEKIAVFNYGNGCDAMLIDVKQDNKSQMLQHDFAQKISISYNHYLKIHNLHLQGEAEYNPSRGAFVSPIMASRNKQLWSRLIGKQCTSCQSILTLPVPSCSGCGGDDFIDYQLSREGTVFAITHEHYFPSKETPLGMATVNLSGGGRMTVQVADENPALKAGDRVELVFRRLYSRDDTPHYFWKCRSLDETL